MTGNIRLPDLTCSECFFLIHNHSAQKVNVRYENILKLYTKFQVLFLSVSNWLILIRLSTSIDCVEQKMNIKVLCLDKRVQLQQKFFFFLLEHIYTLSFPICSHRPSFQICQKIANKREKQNREKKRNGKKTTRSGSIKRFVFQVDRLLFMCVVACNKTSTPDF